MINITSTKNASFYAAIRAVNYQILLAHAADESADVANSFAYLKPDQSSTFKETEERKGAIVQMFLNAKLSGTPLAGLSSYGPCVFDIPLCDGDYSDWTSGI